MIFRTLLQLFLMCGIPIILLAQSPCDSNVLAKKITYDVNFTDIPYPDKSHIHPYIYFPEIKQLVATLLEEVKAGRLEIYYDIDLKQRVPISKIDSMLNPLPFEEFGLTKQLIISPDNLQGIYFWEQWFHNGNGLIEKKIIAYGIYFSQKVTGDADDNDITYVAPGFFVSGTSPIIPSLNYNIQYGCGINSGVFGNVIEIDWFRENIEPSYRRPFTQYFIENASLGNIEIYKDADCKYKITWQDVVRTVKRDPKLTLDQIEWWEHGVFSSFFTDMQFNETWSIGKNGFTKTVHYFGFTYMWDLQKRLVSNLFWVKNR